MAKNILKTVIVITFISIADQLLGFAFRVIISRQIGAVQLGLYQIAFSQVAVLFSLSSSGIPFALGKKIAECRQLKDTKSQSASVTASIVISIAVATIISIIYSVVFILLAKNNPDTIKITLYLLPSVFFLSIYASMRGALWGMKKLITRSLIELSDQLIKILIGLLLLFVMGKNINGGEIVALSFTISVLCGALISLVAYLACGGKFASPKGQLKPLFVSIIPISAIRVAGNLYQTLLATIFPLCLINIAKYTYSNAVAEYGILSGMVLPSIGLPIIFVSAIATTVMPQISANMKINNMDNVRATLTKSYNYSLLFGGLAIGLYFALGQELGGLIFNNQAAGKYIKFACFIMLPIAISSLTTNLLNSLNLEYKSLVNYIIGALSVLAIIWLFTGLIGSYSIIVGVGCGMTIVAVLNTRQIIKVTNLNARLINTTVGIICFSLISAIIGELTCNLLKLFLPLTATLIISGAMCLASYFLLTATYNLGNCNLLLKGLTSIKSKQQVNI